ncbi:hypothetical protein AQI70_34275 [Streptomyces curacoi]|uniref:DUF4386 family protein n=2 Tax=Streptomyces curacoi TaxID=146536 RepID=A0A124GUX0_9ACTN|nr:hypothetical protein AQI70_34275 [Streptomyces curacoi]
MPGGAAARALALNVIIHEERSMNRDRGTETVGDSHEPAQGWTRLAPLSGVVFFVLLVASAVTAQDTPEEYASGAKVLSFFKAHESTTKASALLAGLGVVFLIFFASWLRTYLRSRGASALATAVFGGAVVIGVGGAARAGISWALASGHDKIDPSAAQALGVLHASHYPAVVGIAIFMFATWLSVLRTRALPQWLGWLALPIALIAIVPPTLIPLLAAGVWILIASIVMYVRGGQTGRAA